MLCFLTATWAEVRTSKRFWWRFRRTRSKSMSSTSAAWRSLAACWRLKSSRWREPSWKSIFQRTRRKSGEVLQVTRFNGAYLWYDSCFPEVFESCRWSSLKETQEQPSTSYLRVRWLFPSTVTRRFACRQARIGVPPNTLGSVRFWTTSHAPQQCLGSMGCFVLLYFQRWHGFPFLFTGGEHQWSSMYLWHISVSDHETIHSFLLFSWAGIYSFALGQVKVVSKDAKALALDKEAFDLLLGPLEDIMARKEHLACRKGEPSPT